ncbi:MAG: DUF86 domain-containing protein [Truepera sp.]|nr:DUF86 domain-containing protein [Truepera sp.]
MLPRAAKLLEDIRDAASYILEITEGKTEDDYAQNRMLRQTVERNFEIIGEAVRRLDHHDPATASRISQVARIIAFRNALIHGYDVIDHALVWQVVERSLPMLLNEVEALLAERQDV